MEQPAGHEPSAAWIETDKHQRTCRTFCDFFRTTDTILSRQSPTLDGRHTLLLLRRHSRTAPTAPKWKLSMLTVGSGSSSVVDADAMPFRNRSTSSIVVDTSERRKIQNGCSCTTTTRSSLSPSRNEKQKEELKRGKRCDRNNAGHASLRPPNDLCEHQLFLTLIETALLPQLVSILFAWLMGMRVDAVPNRDCWMLAGCGSRLDDHPTSLIGWTSPSQHTASSVVCDEVDLSHAFPPLPLSFVTLPLRSRMNTNSHCERSKTTEPDTVAAACARKPSCNGADGSRTDEC
ncbi:hypothetical protein BLNAU_8073 [Blattamonas nauphoetae]|uniref:Uncharacterized protein n=1 Tax=Blattamonas nauphoetae TaxID=2049346 RepID=A0ABQ9XZV3_9EUKA|nr:hypothetical protein BLNAU_8073 [Blattamonas nauphoetae]